MTDPDVWDHLSFMKAAAPIETRDCKMDPDMCVSVWAFENLMNRSFEWQKGQEVKVTVMVWIMR
jgi:hypothetical protein